MAHPRCVPSLIHMFVSLFTKTSHFHQEFLLVCGIFAEKSLFQCYYRGAEFLPKSHYSSVTTVVIGGKHS